MSSFFTVPGTQKKRKRAAAPDVPKKRLAASKSSAKGAAQKPAPAPKKRIERDESISGSDSDLDSEQNGLPDRDASEDDSDGSDHKDETAAERRLRLAERYLENVRQEADEEGFDAEEIDRDIIAERLREDVAESKGKVYRKLASELAFERAASTLFRWNSQTVTSVATCAPYAYTTSNDMHLVKWKLQDLPANQWPQTTRRKPKKPPAPPKRKPEKVAWTRGDIRKSKDKNYKGHTGPILAVAASQDGKFVVTAGADRRLVVHDGETLNPIRVFTHHRDSVTGLAFRRGTNQLYSCSKDRTVKVWSLDELAYVETLFGHQDGIVDVDALAQERCVSVGARDRTARLWKVVEETQLVFRGGGRGGGGSDKKARHRRPADRVDGAADAEIDPLSLAHEGSMDRVAMIDDEHFVTGSDNGALSLWSVQKKKALFVLPLAHGLDLPLEPELASAELHPDRTVVPPPQPRWITALRTVPYSDVILSGSWDGCVRVWKLSDDKRKIQAVGVLGGSGVSGDDEGGKLHVNGVNGTTHEKTTTNHDGSAKARAVKGVVNDISMFERGDRGKDGLCVVVAVGKEHRLGRWKKVQGGRNGAIVFEVPRIAKEEAANGVHSSSKAEKEDE